MASVWGELKRRNVVKVAVAYAVVGWLLIEVAATLLPIFVAPGWVLQVFALFVILGFPLALVLSWVFDLTPKGVERTDSGSESGSPMKVGGRNLDFAIIGALVIALGFFAYDYLLDSPSATSEPVSDRRSVAALPFSNESAEEENSEFLANGVHDTLLTQLAKISSLKVISRTSVMEYRDTTKNMRQIGDELGVAAILEGSVQRAGDAVQINVQLIDAETDGHLWASTYNRQLTTENIFAIQAEIASAIAAALQTTILPQEMVRLNEIPTQSTQAWAYYIRGRDYATRADEETYMPLALQEYERALGEDPRFALAWVAISRAHSELYFNGTDRTESRRQRAEEALREAQQLAPDSPETHLALSYYHFFIESDYDSALEELAIAEQGMPGDPLVMGGGILRRAGRWQQSLAAFSRAHELDPRNIDNLENHAETHRYLHNFEEAEQLYDRILEIAPDSALVRFDKASIPLHRDGDVSALRMLAENPPISLGRFRGLAGWTAAFYERDYDRAIDYLGDSGVEGWRGLPASSFFGVTHQLAGRQDLARGYLSMAREGLEEVLDSSTDDLLSAFSKIYLAEVMVHLGENEPAVRMAREAMELLPSSRDAVLAPFIQHAAAVNVFLPAEEYEAAIQELDSYFSGPSSWTIEGLSVDPRLDPIRDDPQFLALVDKHRRQ